MHIQAPRFGPGSPLSGLQRTMRCMLASICCLNVGACGIGSNAAGRAWEAVSRVHSPSRKFKPG